MNNFKLEDNALILKDKKSPRRQKKATLKIPFLYDQLQTA